MGIDGLLPLLRSISVSTHLRELRGQRCAVDAYSWLHRGTYACATELCLEGEASGYVDFCVRLVEALQHWGVEPVLVLDGAPLEGKMDVERSRQASREAHLEKGRRLHALGNARDAAKSFSKAVDVSPEMAKKLVDALRAKSVEYVVAPYEADAQLRYLERIGRVDFIVTEDSDLLAFGATRVLYKLDRNTGVGQMIDSRRLASVEEMNMAHFSQDMFLDMCILCGCDYLDSVEGVGPKRAHALVLKYRTTDRILRGLRFEDKTSAIPADYEKMFWRARLSFRHQRVFCPIENALVHLNPVTDEVRALVSKWGLGSGSGGDDAMEFVGKHLDKDAAMGVATGALHPVTKEVWANVAPSAAEVPAPAAGAPAPVPAPATTAPMATPTVAATRNPFVRSTARQQLLQVATKPRVKPVDAPPLSVASKSSSSSSSSSSGGGGAKRSRFFFGSVAGVESSPPPPVSPRELEVSEKATTTPLPPPAPAAGMRAFVYEADEDE